MKAYLRFSFERPRTPSAGSASPILIARRCIEYTQVDDYAHGIRSPPILSKRRNRRIRRQSPHGGLHVCLHVCVSVRIQLPVSESQTHFVGNYIMNHTRCLRVRKRYERSGTTIITRRRADYARTPKGAHTQRRTVSS